ncbi:glycosyltransferase [Mycolicibacterium holsaticum]|uniref:glycosyltransferase n=1 Tax=Mycolicibacterium holsaticum TaxID=152142 RepID=UPI001C7D3FA9|nr:glycosyltransferase [Mycolicibacterium holsaticum]QZA11413.1 glycosyltransferase [Mycolicibacterium holsaticum DSM 44478 = JCM 12374]UNC11095.1 glycosyltransferase [Mycolicibacterium holsaticum DSM 44478 = JCM 12374]
MKIAMVSEHASPLAVLGGADAGGQNVHVAELSAALARRGHRVTVYTRRDDRGVPERVETAQGYTVVHVPVGPAEPIPKDELLPYMGPFARFLDAEWAAHRPDVTHAHFWMSGIATQLAARHLNLPAVQTFHALGVVKRRYQGAGDTSPSDRLRLEATVARTATWVAATCTDEVFELMRMGRSRNRISVVPCGVDLDLFSPEGPKAARNRYRRIVSVGRFVPRKGFDVMVRALPYIRDTELVIVGGPDATRLDSDPEARRLRALAAELGVADRVRLYGSVARQDMPEILRSADVVACTPWYEPFGIVPLEAMACGVPVVASAVGGMLDTVVHEVTGRLVQPKRPDKVADAINQLLRDDFLRQSLGAAGRDRATARYAWDRIAADTQRIYDRLVPVRFASTEPATSLSSG